MARSSSKPPSRYEIREIIGEGGMGIVYRAFDQAMRREVTLKTIRDSQDTAVLELFRRECDVLGSLAHPNIVEIFDIGEMEVEGSRRPYFVMPFLRGVTLDKLIQSASSRLSLERTVQMIAHICRGLQAAHDQGLVHRDLKPANIFVLDDDSIKIIDFGVAHLIDQRSATGLKGTLLYMAPEQLQLKKPTAVSDQFSLAVITYEMLTLRHPFYVPGLEDLASAIINHSPPPASEINPVIPPMVSQVIHKGLAKEPFHRFSNVREFADCLLKASRNEPIEVFDPSRVEPRLIRAQKAFADSDWDFASEIIRELKSESYLNPEIDRLDKDISDALRGRSVGQLLETARRRYDENEHILALQKIHEVLELDPANRDAHNLKRDIDDMKSSAQVQDWLRLAQQHLNNRSYSHAREALTKLLDVQSHDARARALLAEVDRQEADSARVRQEKQRAYDSALEAFRRGDVDSALSKLERGIDADRQTPSGASSDQANAYQKLYEEVRSKRDQLNSQKSEAKRLLGERRFDAALKVCATVLQEYPDNLVFKFLRDDAEQGLRQETSAFVANVEKEVAEEPDLNRKVAILEDAQGKYPTEQRFEHSLKQVRIRKDLVDSIVARAQSLEQAGNFPDALAQWETLANIHPQYPGLKVEIERITKRRHQQARLGAKANWVAQIDQAANVHDYSRAQNLLRDALNEFPADTELTSLEQTIQQLSNRQAEAELQLASAAALETQGDVAAALNTLRTAFQMAPHLQPVRKGLLDLLLKQAAHLLDVNHAEAEPLVEEAFTIEPKNALARSLRTLINDRRQADEVAQVLTTARALQGQGKNREAIREVDRALLRFPRESRLIQLRATLGVSLSPKERDELRAQDLQELRKLEQESHATTDSDNLDTIFQRTQLFKNKYAGDRDFSSTIATIEKRVTDVSTRKVPVKPVHVDHGRAPGPEGKRGSGKGGSGNGEGTWVPPVQHNPSFWNSRAVQAGLVAAGALAAGLLLILGIRFARTEDTTTVQTPAFTTISVNVPGPYTILDRAGADVSSQASVRGLAANDYRLKTNRPGFFDVDQPFTIAKGEKQHQVAVIWKSLPARLIIAGRGTPEIAGLTFTQTPDGMETELPDGQHHFKWTLGTYTAEADLEVKDANFTWANWNLKGARAFIAAAGAANVKYEAIGFPGVEVTRGTPLAPTGEVPAPAEGANITFRSSTSTRTALGAVPANKPANSAAVIINIFPPTRGSGRPTPTPGAPVPVETTLQPTVTAPPAPAEPQESPADKRRREILEDMERRAKQGKK